MGTELLSICGDDLIMHIKKVTDDILRVVRLFRNGEQFVVESANFSLVTDIDESKVDSYTVFDGVDGFWRPFNITNPIADATNLLTGDYYQSPIPNTHEQVSVSLVREVLATDTYKPDIAHRMKMILDDLGI